MSIANNQYKRDFFFLVHSSNLSEWLHNEEDNAENWFCFAASCKREMIWLYSNHNIASNQGLIVLIMDYAATPMGRRTNSV